MNNIKAIFIDSEGTLRNSDKKVLDETKKVLTLLKEKGIPVILTTGLPRFIARKISKDAETSNYLISSNGADIYNQENNSVIENTKIDHKIIEIIYDLAHNNFNIILGVGDYELSNQVNEYNKFAKKIDNINDFSNLSILQIHISQRQINDELFELYNEYYQKMSFDMLKFLEKNLSSSLYTKLSNNHFKIEKLHEEEVKVVLRAIRFSALKDLQQIVLNNFQKDIHVGNQSIDFSDFSLSGETPWFSLNNINVSKGNAIISLCKYLNIDIHHTIGLGNDYNDLSMINAVGEFICPNSSRGFVKKNNVSIYNDDENGLGKVLKKVYDGR